MPSMMDWIHPTHLLHRHCRRNPFRCIRAFLLGVLCVVVGVLYLAFVHHKIQRSVIVHEPGSMSGHDAPIARNTKEPIRPRAALISLVRNSELSGIQQSIRQLEFHFNSDINHRYPWVFFNDVPFTREFIEGTANLTSGEAYYEVIPKEHWSLPEWIDEKRFMNSLEYLGSIGVGKGWLVSYRHMCRWNSGFFFRHPRLLEFDYYWRVEPNVHYFCDINYDVFKFIREKGIKYGFNINILDDARSFPSLWKVTQGYLNKYPNTIHQESNLEWILSDEPVLFKDYTEGTHPWQLRGYNGCQFFSNFEIGDLNFFRGEEYAQYFEYLDKKGGFFYERWGDAPVHTLAVAMMLLPNETHWFRDIGYQHDVNIHCPPDWSLRCACEPTDLDSGFFTLVPPESTQVRPKESCIKMWLQSQKKYI